MCKVMYDGKRLIPAPFVSIEKQYQTTGDGERIGSVFQITLVGQIVAFKGSPNSNQVFHTSSGYPADEVIDADARLGAILRKQEAIRDLFSNQGKILEVQSADGSQPLKCNPRVISIQYPNELWFNTSSYTITLEADEVSVNGIAMGEDSFTDKISSANESWTIEANEDQPEGLGDNITYRLTHNISAQGKRFFDETGSLQKPAWHHARSWVQARLGFDSAIALSSGVANLPSYYQGVNHLRSENIGENDGSYSITETWVLSSGTAVEEFNVSTTENIEEGLTNVSIDGNVRGFNQRDSNFNITTTKYDNALSKFNAASGLALSRAQSYSGKSLNSQPLNTTVGRNPIAGTISYNFEYNNRPTNLFSLAKTESISMIDSFGVDQFAPVFILGRAAGPLLQDLDTKQPTTRSLSIEAVFGQEFAGGGSASNRLVAGHPRNDSTTLSEINSIVNSAHPVSAGAINNAGNSATVAFVNNQTEAWEPNTGRYNLQIEWTYE